MIIERLDGTVIETEDYGITLLTHSISSPSPRLVTEEIEGRDGYIEVDVTYGGRTIRAAFLMEAKDRQDFPLLRNEVFRIFATKELFYFHEPNQKRRWLVRANNFDIEKFPPIYGRFEVEFTAPNPYAESIGTTLDPFTFDAELWQIGQGLIEADDLKYVHNTPSFCIYNAGDIDIDPRVLPLKIEFTGASTNLTITNQTTGDSWQYTGTTVDGDTITLDGVRSLKNGSSIFGQTNRKLITLKSGWNDFTITGATGAFTISFDFRFYYL
ncbi:Phage tail protein [Parageobacillus thermantarcticus]|uniref:Phage tail protein n=1 Tax=Parageobacillus thermantarcticus TaxID=186116 RepID=A0A1I0TV87_9BACL|nr:phage tail family protein [Parageobacillus thermantarcticus]SFA55672.1 Phage tail protein [Parageobacillus thermantarcticus]